MLKDDRINAYFITYATMDTTMMYLWIILINYYMMDGRTIQNVYNMHILFLSIYSDNIWFMQCTIGQLAYSKTALMEIAFILFVFIDRLSHDIHDC